MTRELHVREYGDEGPVVIVLHGGPGAAGDAAGLARGLADRFRVLEPWQRGGGDEPLTVEGHVRDLHALIESRCSGGRPAIVGHSWGAMLALAHAAAHPDVAGPLVLVGCGTFDPDSRARMGEILDARTDGELRRRIVELPETFPDPGQRLREHYRLIHPLYNYDTVDREGGDADVPPFDLRAHTETWADMLRLQAEGVYPDAFAGIDSPALMLHGGYDPHPGRMIFESLKPFLTGLEYREWERCGHYPWREREVREEFLAVLKDWISLHLKDGGLHA